MLNRSLVILRPAEPYRAWASSLPDIAESSTLGDHRVAYLIPPFDSSEGAQEMLKEAWPVLFDSELSSWCADEALWPQDRDLALFETWFEVEMHALVVDLCAGEILDEWEDDEDSGPD